MSSIRIDKISDIRNPVSGRIVKITIRCTPKPQHGIASEGRGGGALSRIT
jgi:hypothetical protein